LRHTLAIVLAGIALAGAFYFGSLKLAQASGSHYCTGVSLGFGPRGGCSVQDWKYRPGVHYRATWQLPAAIVTAAVGFGAAVAVARRT
jgi:hypothetical protein